jgi:hypothetical protein
MGMFDSFSDDNASEEEPEDNPSFEDVYPEDVENWRNSQNEINRNSDEN